MRKRRDLGQPSDIAFLLIIFFLLLAGINTTQALALRSGTGTQEEEVPLQALLTQQGTILLDDQSYSPFEFAMKLNPNTTLHLKVESETSWQQVVDLLSLTEQRQIAGLSLTLADGVTPAIAAQGEGERKQESHIGKRQKTRNLAGEPESKQLEDTVKDVGKTAENTREMAP